MGASWSSSGRSTASRGTAAPKSRRGTGRSGTSRTSATGAARRRSSASCTTTPSTPCGARCRRRRVGGPDTAGSGGAFMRDFLEHCLRGTNHATGQDRHAARLRRVPRQGRADVRRRPRADGHRQPACARSTTAFAIVASFPELKGKPIVIGESDPDGCAACQGPQLGYRNGDDVFELHGRQLRPQARPGREARRQPRRRADLGVRVRGPAVLRRVPRAGDQRHRPAGAERLPHVQPDGRRAARRSRATARCRSTRSCKQGVREQPDVAALASLDGEQAVRPGLALPRRRRARPGGGGRAGRRPACR